MYPRAAGPRGRPFWLRYRRASCLAFSIGLDQPLGFRGETGIRSLPAVGFALDFGAGMSRDSQVGASGLRSGKGYDAAFAGSHGRNAAAPPRAHPRFGGEAGAVRYTVGFVMEVF